MAQSLKFIKTATVGTSGLTAGAVYFETSTGLIKVAKSASEVEVFGGNLKDFSFENSKLTLTKADDSKVVLDFSDVPSAEGIQSLISNLRKDVNAAKEDVSNLQSATGIADDATAISIEGLTATTVVDALEELYDLVDAAAQGGVLSLNGATGDLITVGVNKTTGAVTLTIDETALVEAIADAKKAGTDAQDAADAAQADATAALDAIGDETKGLVKAVADAQKAADDAQSAADDAQAAADDAMAEAEKKVDKVEGSRLMTDAEGTKLAGITEGANKVEASDVNGNIKIDGEEVTVYTLPEQTDYSVTVDASTPLKYIFSQKGAEIATINIPKDLMVRSGSVVTNPEGQTAGTYIELVLNTSDNDETAEKIYVNVADLIEYVTAGSEATDDVIVAVSSDHKVTATLNADVLAKINQAHTHGNLDVLKDITADQVTAWDAVAAKKADYDEHVADADIHVTTTDKETWSGKQDAFDNADVLAAITAEDVAAWDAKQEAITDLEDIRDGAALGATSVQDVKIGGTSIVEDSIAAFSFAPAVDGNVNLSMDSNNVVSAELTWALFA